jgi:ribosomal protein S18 acetylase RimI-like enzyme
MIRLVRMDEAEYQAYLEKSIPAYAADKLQAGNWTADEALERAQLEYGHFLPQGVDTPGHFVGKLLNEVGEVVGYLWYAGLDNNPGTAFIFDFEIYETFRRRGYASEALAVLVDEARGQGYKRLALHVFGANTAARMLYKKNGFIETNVQMARDI